MAGELLGFPEPNLATLTAAPPQDDDSDPPQEPQQWIHGGLLPVQVILRDLAARPPGSSAKINAETVWEHIQNKLKHDALEDFAPHLRAELLQRGGLILLDGLDEVPDAEDRRQQIKTAVQEFAATFSKCRYLVTSRTYAYQRQEWKLNGFSEVQLAPFTLGQIN